MEDKPTPEQIKAMVEKEIPIDYRIHCYRERMKREGWRLLAIRKLMKKHGYG